MNDIQKKIQEELAKVQDSKFAKRSDAQMAYTDRISGSEEWSQIVKESKKKITEEQKEKHRKMLQERHKDPAYQEKLKKGLKRAWAKEGFKETHKAAVREANAIPKELVVKIFTEFHNPAREVDDKTYKKSLSDTYGITISHLNKICMARSNYVRECIGLSESKINVIKQTYIDSKSTYTYRLKTFGIDVIDLYKDYSYRSKFSVQQVWEFRFGKYKGMKRKQLERALGIQLSRDDADSFKKSYSWLTDLVSREIVSGTREEVAKFGPTPTRSEKIKFIKTGKYQGCFIIIE
jgi:hypothetical protein